MAKKRSYQDRLKPRAFHRPLSPECRATLHLLAECHARGEIPSARDIAKHFGLASVNAVHSRLHTLRYQGLLSPAAPNHVAKARTYLLTDAGWAALAPQAKPVPGWRFIPVVNGKLT